MSLPDGHEIDGLGASSHDLSGSGQVVVFVATVVPLTPPHFRKFLAESARNSVEAAETTRFVPSDAQSGPGAACYAGSGQGTAQYLVMSGPQQRSTHTRPEGHGFTEQSITSSHVTGASVPPCHEHTLSLPPARWTQPHRSVFPHAVRDPQMFASGQIAKHPPLWQTLPVSHRRLQPPQ